LTYAIHPEFQEALAQNPEAGEVFEHLPPSHQKQYLVWIETAKRPETRQRRIAEALRMLAGGQKLGLK
jgi:uncharacterized protein YdeI (YjbR/CyaY-like superfamily)